MERQGRWQPASPAAATAKQHRHVQRKATGAGIEDGTAHKDNRALLESAGAPNSLKAQHVYKARTSVYCVDQLKPHHFQAWHRTRSRTWVHSTQWAQGGLL